MKKRTFLLLLLSFTLCFMQCRNSENKNDSQGEESITAPSGLAATAASSAQINLSWTDNSDNEQSFQIQRKTTGDFARITEVDADLTSYSDTGLNPSTEYTYRVVAVKNSLTSGFSNTASATTNAVPITAPAAPSALKTTTVSSARINLSWTDNSDNEQSFQIQRKTTGDFATITSVNANTTTYINSGLTASTTYTYRVRAVNTAGNSAFTDGVSATTNALPVASSLISDHTHIDRNVLSNASIAKAAALKIFFGHTSHGSQIIDGINGLKTFDTRFASAPTITENPYTDYCDLATPDRKTWETDTRKFLAAYPDTDVVMWSWCKGVSSASEDQINYDYLSKMSKLETDFPDVVFVYMTGHLDGTGLEGNLNLRNEQIRNYCRTNNKYLYDFADIESYDPDGNYYLDKYAYDDCTYDSDGNGSADANWATAWQGSHTKGTDWYDCYCAHSQPINGNMKAYAAWYLWTVIADNIE